MAQDNYRMCLWTHVQELEHFKFHVHGEGRSRLIIKCCVHQHNFLRISRYDDMTEYIKPTSSKLLPVSAVKARHNYLNGSKYLPYIMAVPQHLSEPSELTEPLTPRQKRRMNKMTPSPSTKQRKLFKEKSK